ncbi:MAG: DUF362 domain-containing protein [Planctomycetota bacterium]
MQKKDKGLTRRDFLRSAAGVAMAGAAGSRLVHAQEEDGQTKKAPVESEAPVRKTAGNRSAVVLIRDKDVIDDEGTINGEVIKRMLDEGVTALLGASSPEEAWKRLIKPDDTVGIKSNAWRFMPTPPELEEAIMERVRSVGVAEDKVAVDDRRVLIHPVFKEATALINVRTLRTHHWSGVGSCIKNYIMFHRSPPSWHEDSCANLAGLWDLPEVKGKTRLNIQVMLTPLFHGKGPHHFQAKYTWPYKGMILGVDPVAVDATAVRVLEAQRKLFFGCDEPFSVPPKHIQVAEEKFHLGVADPGRIDVIKKGWAEGMLI